MRHKTNCDARFPPRRICEDLLVALALCDLMSTRTPSPRNQPEHQTGGSAERIRSKLQLQFVPYNQMLPSVFRQPPSSRQSRSRQNQVKQHDQVDEQPVAEDNNRKREDPNELPAETSMEGQNRRPSRDEEQTALVSRDEKHAALVAAPPHPILSSERGGGKFLALTLPTLFPRTCRALQEKSGRSQVAEKTPDRSPRQRQPELYFSSSEYRSMIFRHGLPHVIATKPLHWAASPRVPVQGTATPR